MGKGVLHNLHCKNFEDFQSPRPPAPRPPGPSPLHRPKWRFIGYSRIICWVFFTNFDSWNFALIIMDKKVQIVKSIFLGMLKFQNYFSNIRFGCYIRQVSKERFGRDFRQKMEISWKICLKSQALSLWCNAEISFEV